MQNVYLSIIIVGYTYKEVIRNYLSSIYQNLPEQPFEIIPVDNNALDESQKAIERPCCYFYKGVNHPIRDDVNEKVSEIYL